jgi:hypothetical protein
MAHLFEVELTPPNEWGARLAIIRVDGRPLIDIIEEVESPLAAADGQPDLAGKYGYLNAVDVMFPSRQLLGEAVRPLLDYDDKVSVLECDCGCEGCWPLLMRITATEDSVFWSEPRQPHRGHWHYPPEWHLVFERRQYERALGFPA